MQSISGLSSTNMGNINSSKQPVTERPGERKGWRGLDVAPGLGRQNDIFQNLGRDRVTPLPECDPPKDQRGLLERIRDWVFKHPQDLPTGVTVESPSNDADGGLLIRAKLQYANGPNADRELKIKVRATVLDNIQDRLERIG